MNSKRTILIIISMIISCLLPLVPALAQQKAALKKDTTGAPLAARLGINRARAKRLAGAYNFKSAEIARLMADTAMKPALRRQKLHELLDERNRQLNVMMTKGLRDTIKNRMGDPSAQAEQRRQAQQARFEARLNQVPHRIHSGTERPDSAAAKRTYPSKTTKLERP